MRRHRGVTAHTLCRYRRALDLFVTELGEDPTAYVLRAVDAVAAGKTRRKPPAPPAPTVPFDPPGALLDRLVGRPPRHRPEED